jgi:tetratricopeptide (TPR) repeat protein
LATKENSEAVGTAPAAKFSGGSLSKREAALALSSIQALVFLAYLSTLWFKFVYDDSFQVLGNTWLRSWNYLPRYFTADVWAFAHPGFRATFYRPIFLIWLRLQYLVFGLDPVGWHFATILCHLAATLLVYFIAARLLEDRLAALFASLIFGLHPTHTEAVAWVSGVTEPLFTVFLLASYLCYLKKRAEPKRARIYLAASLLLYALASLSKETAVVLPVIIFAGELLWGGRTDSAPRHTWLRRSLDALRVVAPYVALFAVYLVARLLALRGFQNTKGENSVLSMCLTWPAVLWFYVRHLLWPTQLSPFYSQEFYTTVGFSNVLAPAIPVLAVVIGLILWAKRSPTAAVATLWMVVPVLPVLNLRVFFGGHLVHDRYLYLPCFGFAMLVALGIRHLNFGQARLWRLPMAQIGVIAALGLAMGLEIHASSACYADQTAFFTYVASKSAVEHSYDLNWAGLLGNQGRLQEAIKIYEAVLRTQPDDWTVNYNLGYAYYLVGNLAEADRFLTRAVQIDPTPPEGFFYLGLTKLKLGDVNSAAANVQRAISIQPDSIHYHFALGVIFRLQGNLAGALSEFDQELDLDPDDRAARSQIAEIEAAQAAGQKGTGENSGTRQAP